MAVSSSKLKALLQRVGESLQGAGAASPEIIARLRSDLAASTFHLSAAPNTTPVVVVLGGTGTGKSTLVNRLVDQPITAASFRRTFTAGCIAVARSTHDVPDGWLGIPHDVNVEIPARGTLDRLTVVESENVERIVVDTPDLDGDRPAHHAQADRAFRWANAILFVVTPEKYQMTELLAYYRLAKRYDIPVAFVMNKAEERAVVDDYRELLKSRDWPDASIFVIPRDDAAFEPASEETIESLRHRIRSLHEQTVSTAGTTARLRDIASRLRDQIIAPARASRTAVDSIIAQLHALESPLPGVDVNPLTQQLQRRLQQRSVLYLMGPQRVLDRARQVPSLLARLPRAAWDYVVSGEFPKTTDTDFGNGPRTVPDFRQLLIDAFAVVRTRVDDIVRASPAMAIHLTDSSYAGAFLPTGRAGEIADEELAELNRWLESRWNASPRDTKLLQKLLRVLPGGQKLSQWSEAAPYLLAIVVATHHAFFGHVDLLILGGYSIATWLTERMSNEVASRTRATNRAISDRFTRIAHEQVMAMCEWLQSKIPDANAIDSIERAANGLEEAVTE